MPTRLLVPNLQDAPEPGCIFAIKEVIFMWVLIGIILSSPGSAGVADPDLRDLLLDPF
jgi:hypothetical protein